MNLPRRWPTARTLTLAGSGFATLLPWIFFVLALLPMGGWSPGRNTRMDLWATIPSAVAGVLLLLATVDGARHFREQPPLRRVFGGALLGVSALAGLLALLWVGFVAVAVSEHRARQRNVSRTHDRGTPWMQSSATSSPVLRRPCDRISCRLWVK